MVNRLSYSSYPSIVISRATSRAISISSSSGEEKAPKRKLKPQSTKDSVWSTSLAHAHNDSDSDEEMGGVLSSTEGRRKCNEWLLDDISSSQNNGS